MEKFRALGLSERTISALEKKGFEEPSEVQALTIPPLLSGDRDVIAQAQTGTGKTAAFSLPILENMEPGLGHVQAIILAPTRELVIQVVEEINSLKGNHKISVSAVYGGQSIERQLTVLRRGVDIVVGTPGRVMDHLRRKSLKLDKLSYFILDEADEMLNMGFVDDIETILESTSEEKRILLFSATMPHRIKKLAEKYLQNELYLKTKQKLTANLTDQIYYEVHYRDKFEALCRIVDIEETFYAIVFCRTKVEVDEISNHLNERGYMADSLHGDISQQMRERILQKFRKKKLTILVATDVAARGIDVTDLTHVINYSLPQNAEAYTHRIGRTGRAGKEGTAITFVTPSEFRKLGFIKRETKAEIRKESVPAVKDVISRQQKQITELITGLTDEGDIERFREWGDLLLESQESSDLVAALLTHAFGKKLDERNYNEISPVRQQGNRNNRDRNGGRNDRNGGRFERNDRNGGRNERSGGRFERNDRGPRNDRGGDRGGRFERSPVDEGGRTRLFVAQGKKDGYNKKQLVRMVGMKSGIDFDAMQHVNVRENYSFITVPFQEAEKILRAFKDSGRGSKPMIEKANPAQ